MRSVFVHLIGVTKDAVRARLSEFADGVGDEWRYPRSSNSHTLEIGFYDDLELDSEPEELEALRLSLGRLPDLIVYTIISGRIPGDAEARQFVTFLLRHFRGVAWDDYTPHCWTLVEIESDRQVSGHSFFDYDGWYREKHGA